MDEKNLKELSKKVIAKVKEEFDELKRGRGFFACMKIGAKSIVEVVQEFGVIYSLSGPEKKSLAIHVGLELIPDVPWMPDSVIAYFLDWAIESAYAAMKKLRPA